ncbi:hypothetical protein ACNHYB_08460 [Isoptericola jiangsuensis]|uniref:hypothetical protein n=1 Tax=Isoptericola jiangsuensis TaxID=548579 RepID=UPI003AAF4D4A
MCVALVVGIGTVAGYGVGRGVDWVRDVWPDPPVQLLAEKVAPPEALDPAGVAETCAPSAVALDLVTDGNTFTRGDAMDFTLRVTNEGRVGCLVDSATSSMQVVVTGPDDTQVWSSADCASTKAEPALLAPGWSWEIEARWSGITSTEGCEGKPSKLEPGTYTATMALGDVPGAEGEPTTVTLEAPPEPEPDPTPSDEPSEGADDADGEKKSAATEASDESAEEPKEKAADEPAEEPAEDEPQDAAQGSAEE